MDCLINQLTNELNYVSIGAEMIIKFYNSNIFQINQWINKLFFKNFFNQ